MHQDLQGRESQIFVIYQVLQVILLQSSWGNIAHNLSRVHGVS